MRKNTHDTIYERVTLEKYFLTDDKLPVSCYGHVLKREVTKYQQLGNTGFIDKVIIDEAGPVALLNNLTSWPSASFYADHFFNHSMEIPRNILSEKYAQNTPGRLNLINELPKRVHDLGNFEYFIGKDPKKPNDQDIIVKYTCSSYPTLTVWGKLNDGMLTAGSKGVGVSDLPVPIVQKKNQEKENSLAEFFPFIVLINMSALISVLLRYLMSQNILRMNIPEKYPQIVGMILLLGLLFIPINVHASAYIALLLIAYSFYDLKYQK